VAVLVAVCFAALVIEPCDERLRGLKSFCMSKPRTFISSTCFDFADARAGIADHLKALGHEPIRSDTPNFGVSLGKHSHNACLDQVDNCDYLVLLIGGRRGGTFVGSEKSITNEEYRHALKKHKPVIAFVKRDVQEALRAYKKNPSADFSYVVDDVRVFDFIELVGSQSENNWIRTFNDSEEVKQALTDQFAYIALEYSKQLIRNRMPDTSGEDKREVIPFPTQLGKLADKDNSSEAAHTIAGMKRLHEVISSIATAKVAGKDEKLRLLWVMGRYGKVGMSSIAMGHDRFKQYAWGTGKGQKVFNQISDFGLSGEYDDDGNGEMQVRIWFKGDENAETAHALSEYVAELVKTSGEDIGLDRFKRGDMRVYV